MSLKTCITGANRGLGLGLTEHYLHGGAQVLAVARQATSTPALKSLSLKYPQRLILIDADIAQAETLGELQKHLEQEPLDLLINNAGVILDRKFNFQNLPLDALRQSFEVNVIGTIAVTQLALAALKKGQNPTVAMLSSLMGSLADNSSGGYYAYRSSKAALNMVTKSLALDHPWLLTVALHPGWVQTDMGGPQASITVQQSVTGLAHVIQEMKNKDSGRFFNYQGQSLPW